MPYNYTCRFCEHTTPPTTLKAYYTTWYPNDPPNVEVGPHYGEQTLVVPSIPQWQWVTVTWRGTASAPAGKYLFVATIDPDNVLAEANENNNGIKSEFYIADSSPLIFTEGPNISPSTEPWATPEAVSIKWKTSHPCQTMVYYGLTSGYGLTLNTGYADSGNAYMVNLQQNTSYHYKVVCTPRTGKTIDSGDRTFMTGSTSVSTPTPTPVPTASVSFSPLDSSQISAMANILDAVESIVEKLNNLLLLIRR